MAVPSLNSSTSLIFSGLLVSPLMGGVSVNAPLPITNTVTIQPYRAVKSDGTAAIVMGGGVTQDYITGEVAKVLAQSGLSANWLPVEDLVSDFIYDGSPNDYSSTQRPVGEWRDGEFHDIISSTPPSSTVLKMYFVEIVPGYSQTSELTANGYAWIDANGVVLHVGETLLTTPGGRDVVASVIAHEIAHNLGLGHVENSSNLMFAFNRATEQILASQTSLIFTNDLFADGYELLGAPVSPSNYSIWAESLGLTGDPGDDDDLDGLANVLEFMLGLNGAVPDNDAMPSPSWSTAGLTWSLPKLSDALDDGLTYAIEVSRDASTWNPAGTPGSGSSVLADTPSVLTVRLDAGSPVNLMRIKVDLTGSLLGGSQSLPAPEAASGRSGDDAIPLIGPRPSGCGVHGCGSCTHEAP